MASILFIPGFLVGGGIGGGVFGHLVGNGSLNWWTGIGIANTISALGCGGMGLRQSIVGRMDAGEGMGKAMAFMFLCSIGGIGALVTFIVAANNGFEMDGTATGTAVLTAVIPPLACALLLTPFSQIPHALPFTYLGPYFLGAGIPLGAAALSLVCAGGIVMMVMEVTREMLAACWQKISGAPPESGDGDSAPLRARVSERVETAEKSGARLARQLSSNRFVKKFEQRQPTTRTHELARATSV